MIEKQQIAFCFGEARLIRGVSDVGTARTILAVAADLMKWQRLGDILLKAGHFFSDAR